ncbi:MAG: SDR family NAD(P)-dependent oxidoreductase [Streptosporangiaceae bacterium]
MTACWGLPQGQGQTPGRSGGAGGLDVLVHCVGASFAKPGGALALTDDDWMQTLNTNLLSAVRLDRAILPGMVAGNSLSDGE